MSGPGMSRAEHEEAVVEPAAAEAVPRVAPGVDTAGRGIGRLTPGNVLRLQRAAGNAAVTGLVPAAQAAAALRRERARRARPPADARFRLPSAAEIKQLHTGGVIPPDIVEESVKLAVERMEADIFTLRTDAADVMKHLFPKPGVFDEAGWKMVLGTGTSDVYKSVADAEAKLKPADKTKLEDAAKLAVDEINKAEADEAGLKEVFGGKWKEAKKRYGLAREALKKAIKNADTAIDTDYNRDDPQVGLGGWAQHATGHMHLTGDVAEVRDLNDTIVTLIHEAAHLGHGSVDDLGYYLSDGFEAMQEDQKVNNAAHYEELPRRSLGTSSFAKTTFTPGKTASGGAVTFEDEVRREASEYLRMAWDAAVDAHQFVRQTAKEILANPGGKVFEKKKKALLEVSKMEHLTIHRQTPAPTTVTTLDAVLSEGVAHATVRIQNKAGKQAVPSSGDKKKAVDAVIDGSIADYGHLLGNAADDRKLMDWLVKHYRKGF